MQTLLKSVSIYAIMTESLTKFSIKIPDALWAKGAI